MNTLCANVQSHGTCSDASCPYRHNMLICEDCGVALDTEAAHQAHLVSKRHLNQIAGRSMESHCPLCQLNVSGTVNWKQHVQGQRHRNRAAVLGVSPDVQPTQPVAMAGMAFCNICERQYPERNEQYHLRSPMHLKKEKFAGFRSVIEEAEKDKHGVTISGAQDFGILDPEVARAGVNIQFSIQTTVPASQIKVIAISHSTTTVSTNPPVFAITIRGSLLTYGSTLRATVKFKEVNIGRYNERYEIMFEDMKLRQRFIIARSFKAIVGNQADHELLKPRAPYVARSKGHREAELDVVEGVMPEALRAIPYVVRLPQAPIPKPLADGLSIGTLKDRIARARRLYLPRQWDTNSYSRHFKNLLWIEEHQMESDLEMYDISDTKLTRHGPYFYLEVPGLAEKRPSVLVGDRILVQTQGGSQGRWFEGGVHVVRKEEVGLRFHASFGWSASQRYTVRFKLNRFPMRREHQAMDTAFAQERLLLPTIVHVRHQSVLDLRLQVFNKLIATNGPQLQAIRSIVQREPGAAPFVLFGPPGTGKTVTVVEAIRQLLTRNSNARIMACAPSNSAADLIASRLTALGKNELYRFYAPSRSKDEVPDDLLPFTIRNADGHFSIPPLATLKRFRVIVTTAVSASMPYGVGMPRGHFTHIFFDEAGQATEPETMIAIKTMADNATNIILSGDPKQLGPIIRSNVARELGLETSYLERLMNRELYSVTPSRPSVVVKLIKNFRSHAAILKFPNERFYSNELQPCAEPAAVDALLGSPQLATANFPIIFHALCGKDDREASSPSFFNIDEVSQVKAYITALRADRRYRITDQDIGVIAPYHAQCRRLRTVLRPIADGVKVGSVEEFQGQERKIIIISTVRSSREFIQYDVKHTLGFVANPRRFNVAVTRAKALLIVVGDPTVLSLDPLWRSFLNYIHRNKGWKGPSPSWDTRDQVVDAGGYDRQVRDAGLADMNDFTRRMESLTLAGVDFADDGQDADANVDRAWAEQE